MQCLQNWDAFMRLAGAGVLMICLEWWSFEISLFIIGSFGELELAAMSILFQTESLFFAFPLGFGLAGGIIIGRYLGAGDAEGAAAAARVAYIVSIFAALVNGSLVLALKNVIPMAFTTDTEIIQRTSELMPYLAVIIFFVAYKGVISGIVKGAGHQFWGAIISLVGYAVFSFPISLPLLYLTNLRIEGYWIGLCVGAFCTDVFYSIVTARIDWHVEVDKAIQRLARPALHAADHEQTNTDGDETAPLIKRGEKSCTTLELSISVVPVRPGLVSFTATNVSSDNLATPELDTATKRRLVIKRGALAAFTVLILIAGIVARMCTVITAPELDAAAGNHTTPSLVTST